jgi:outer membrane PBP1 activator LpoA protein
MLNPVPKVYHRKSIPSQMKKPYFAPTSTQKLSFEGVSEWATRKPSYPAAKTVPPDIQQKFKKDMT